MPLKVTALPMRPSMILNAKPVFKTRILDIEFKIYKRQDTLYGVAAIQHRNNKSVVINNKKTNLRLKAFKYFFDMLREEYELNIDHFTNQQEGF